MTMASLIEKNRVKAKFKNTYSILNWKVFSLKMSRLKILIFMIMMSLTVSNQIFKSLRIWGSSMMKSSYYVIITVLLIS